MATPAEERDVINSYLQRALTVARAAEGEAATVAADLLKTYSRIANDIRRIHGERLTKKSVKEIVDLVDEELYSYYQVELPKRVRELTRFVVAKEVEWNVKTIRAFTGEEAAKISIPKHTQVAKRAAKKTYQGHTFDYWAKREYGKSSKAVTGAIREGFIKSEPISEIEKRVASIANRSRRDVRTIVRSSVAHHAQEAKDTVFSLNPEIIEGAIWVSTLDHRTTPHICGPRDGLLYDNERNPVGHSYPWGEGPGRIHWNCRSTSVPKLIGVAYNGNRAAIEPGENYKRGDAKTRTGRVRKPNKDAREKGIFKVEQKTTKTRYENWLRERSKTNLDFVADVLGSKRKARDFRDGNITLADLALENPVSRPTDRNSL